MIKVIHKKNSDKYKNVFYVGRGSALGNPYTSIQGRETKAQFVVDTKEESIEKYKEYLNDCIEKKDEKVCNLLNEIFSLAMKEDVYLSCYCSPRKCHGDIIKQLIEEKIKERMEEVDKGENQLKLKEIIENKTQKEKLQSFDGAQLNIFEDKFKTDLES